ncbi:sugar ABC transporter substrate-binding protein [Feifania hominis]|uniref:Sugar ABC transporter substrate-binding protein n=1 Tax=Feifania hominis TaxID=2763660 RepID=A0A926HTL2_9FIRM|nr:sugar ABC transporter substrate-binding protein [Feifania hominis]MBC8535984.1 sugar ABC transporter substrate-binding protein [Feifania hominis]
MKRWISLLLAVCMLFSLAACSNGQEPTPPDGDQTQPGTTNPDDEPGTTGEPELVTDFTVGISLNNLDQYQTMMYETLVEEVEALGGKVTMFNADGSVEKQLADVESLITLAPDVIVVQSVDPDGSVPAVVSVKQAGIPVVVYQLQMNVKPDQYDAMVNVSDSGIRGKMQARWLKNWLDEHPGETLKIGYLLGAPNGGNVGYKGFAQELYEDEKYKDRVEEVINKNANWLMQEAVSIVEDWLVAHPEINVIAAENDEMAMAAVNVISSAGLDPSKYLTLGMNGDPQAQELILEGKMSMSAFNSKRIICRICAQTCQKLASGIRFDGDKFIDTIEAYMYPMDITNVQEIRDSGIAD